MKPLPPYRAAEMLSEALRVVYGRRSLETASTRRLDLTRAHTRVTAVAIADDDETLWSRSLYVVGPRDAVSVDNTRLASLYWRWPLALRDLDVIARIENAGGLTGELPDGPRPATVGVAVERLPSP